MRFKYFTFSKSLRLCLLIKFTEDGFTQTYVLLVFFSGCSNSYNSGSGSMIFFLLCRQVFSLRLLLNIYIDVFTGCDNMQDKSLFWQFLCSFPLLTVVRWPSVPNRWFALKITPEGYHQSLYNHIKHVQFDLE